MGQQNFDTRITGYIDLFSLAQRHFAMHQEYKSEKILICEFSRAGFLQLRKTRACYLGVFAA